jgi:putative transposase
MLGDKIAYYNRTKFGIETGEMLKITPAKYKSDFKFLKEVDSLALANAQLNLDRAYKNFFRDKRVGFPKYKSKKNHHYSYTTNNQDSTIRIENNCLKLPKVGFVKTKLHRNIPENYTLKSVTVSKTPSGKYFASILFEYEQIVIPANVEKTLGLDYSMSEVYVDSEGKEPQYNRYYRRSLAKLQKISRTLSKMKKFSQNWYKQKHKIAVLHEKIANQRKDFLHKESSKIANSYDLVGVEDLNMKAMSQALNFGKSVSDNSWGMFRTLLKYKLEEAGKYFVTIDKWFPSSKKCSTYGCDYVYKDLTMDIREWTCPQCGVTHNRDVNAAINIRNEAMRMFAESKLVLV